MVFHYSNLSVAERMSKVENRFFVPCVSCERDQKADDLRTTRGNEGTASSVNRDPCFKLDSCPPRLDSYAIRVVQSDTRQTEI